MQESTLKGRTALITGGGKGLGLHLVNAFVQAGADVSVHCGRSPISENNVDKLQQSSGKLFLCSGDLSHRGAPEALLDKVMQEMSAPDILVNCAANQQTAMLADQSVSGWNNMSELNVGSVFALSRAVANAGSSGAIVNIASIEAVRPNREHAAYAASKAAMMSLTRSLALEYGPKGWRANAVAPGLIRRDDIEAAWPEGVSRWCAAAAMERMVEPAEVASACVFLCSSAASGITGALVPVDCGLLATPGW